MAKVLLVDDDVAVVQRLSRWTSAERHQVEAAFTAAEAVRAVQLDRFDLVVVDRQLPDGSGIDAMRQLRNAGLIVPFVVLTDHGGTALAVEAMRAGAINVLDKPVRQTVFASTLELALGMPWPLGSPDRHEIVESVNVELQMILDEVVAQGHRVESEIDQGVARSLKQRLIRLLSSQALGASDFCFLSRASRRAFAGDWTGCETALQEAMRVLLNCVPRSLLAEKAIQRIEMAGDRWPRLSAEDLCAALGCSERKVTAALRDAIGLDLRGARIIVVVKRLVASLSQTNDQIAQVAYRLGYSHPSILDRHCNRVLGMSPVELRAILRWP